MKIWYIFSVHVHFNKYVTLNYWISQQWFDGLWKNIFVWASTSLWHVQDKEVDGAVSLCYSFYKGLVPLWARQIPYTMMKFSCFERTLEALYKYVVPKPRSECNKSEQLMTTFVAGYIGKCVFVYKMQEIYILVWKYFRNSNSWMQYEIEGLKKIMKDWWLRRWCFNS